MKPPTEKLSDRIGQFTTIPNTVIALWPKLGTDAIGLPVPLLQDQAQAEAVMASLKTLKRLHSFDIGKDRYRVTINRLQALAQPVGAYIDWLLQTSDGGLNPRKGGRDAEVSVLDLGMNTLDLYVIQGGRVDPRWIGGAKVGVRRLLEHAQDSHDLEEMDALLRVGSLRIEPAALNTWLSEVLGSVEHHWPSLKRFTAVIPTGGGALVLGGLLVSALAAKGAAVYMPPDPITANVTGLWKWGAYNARKN